MEPLQKLTPRQIEDKVKLIIKMILIHNSRTGLSYYTSTMLNDDELMIRLHTVQYPGFKVGPELRIDYRHRFLDGTWSVNPAYSEHFAVLNVDDAIEAFYKRMMSPDPKVTTDLGQRLHEIFQSE